MYKGILLSHERIKAAAFAETWVDLETVTQSEGGQRKQTSHFNASMWNLEKWYR